jgi:hypothetical protein
MKIRFHVTPFPTHNIYPRPSKTDRGGNAFTRFFSGTGSINPIIYRDLEEKFFSARYILKSGNNMSHHFRKPQPFSEARRAAARANGAKSQGPVTPEGKAKSALNAITHGLTASTLVLSTESKERYEALLASYREKFDPDGPIENDLVEEIVAAKWQQRRVASMITALIDVAMDRMETEIRNEFENIDNAVRTALAFDKQAQQSGTLALLNRYATRHARDYHRALNQLRQIQSECEAGPRPAAGSQPAKTPAQPDPPAAPEPTPDSNTTNMQNEPSDSPPVTSHKSLATETGHRPPVTDHCFPKEPKPSVIDEVSTTCEPKLANVSDIGNARDQQRRPSPLAT